MRKKRMINLVLLTMLFFGSLSGQQVSPGLAPGSGELDAIKANLEIAHAQHEIIMLLIKNNDFQKVWPEAQRLLELSFPADQERATVQSIALITHELTNKGRPDIAHLILDKAAEKITDPANCSRIYLLSARLYKQQGLDLKAIEAFRKSQQLSARSLTK